MQTAAATPIPMSSFDGRTGSYPSSQDGSQPMYHSQQSAMSNYRSFGDQNGSMINPHASHTSHNSQHSQHSQGTPVPAPVSGSQIYTAVYSGVQVYEFEINGVAVMRRRDDSWLNATQILKVAGVDKGKRTKVLEKEILNGEHEKVQGGYGKYQGTWINYRRGREFCRQYGVEELLRPLLDYDMSIDGSGQPGTGIDTPTKEQAMAANRKRFYNQSQDGRIMPASVGGTFFSNLSPAASNALSAMNKAARLNTPPQRPSSAPRRPASATRSLPNSQESFHNSQPVNTQRSMPSLANERSFHEAPYAQSIEHPDAQEPPRKRMRASSPKDFVQLNLMQMNGNTDSFMRDGTPTEPNDSFLYRPSNDQDNADGDIPIAQPPLPHPTDKHGEEKQSLLLDLFADLNRTEYSNHPAIQHLSGKDLDYPLDNSANTALHWAATLARIPLMKLLIERGASIFRGNIAGETPLMAAVQVNNCLDHTCFPDLLDILSPLIEIRDAKSRTILHHIAVASGIKGRASSSKYYLEALLEFLVRRTTNASNDGSSSSVEASSGLGKPIGLMRFMSEMVNARDIAGNTALNLVARIGNRSIIRQLIEVQADPMIPNHKGLRPVDFGVEASGQDTTDTSQPAPKSPTPAKTPSKADEASMDILPTISTSITEMSNQFSHELRFLQDRMDKSTAEIRNLSAEQKTLTQQVESQQAHLRSRQDRKKRLQNLRRAIGEIRDRLDPNLTVNGPLPVLKLGDADAEYMVPEGMNEDDPEEGAEVNVMTAQVNAYNTLLASLATHLTSLKSRDIELENKYRKVVAMCTNVDEDMLDTVLPQLVMAVEHEPEGDMVKVRDFIKRVEAVSAP